MAGPPPGVAAVRLAVRRALDALPEGLVLVACSGGTDSLALADAVAFETARSGRTAGACVVDHGLQPGSAQVADRAAGACRRLGLDPVVVRRVEVDAAGGGGPEAAARVARLDALDRVAAATGAVAVLLAHTRDDQAEQVLLGLARGSGARSLAGMPARRGLLVRPLLGVTRADTAATCAHAGLEPWQDPHNGDDSYARVRARRLLPLLEQALGPGVRDALARTADQLRADADALDALAQAWLAAHATPSVPGPTDASGTSAAPGQGGPGESGPGEEGPGGAARSLCLPAAALAREPRAIRSRVLRRAAVAVGALPGELAATHVEALDGLVVRWHGQGPLPLPGHVTVTRTAGRQGRLVLTGRGAPPTA